MVLTGHEATQAEVTFLLFLLLIFKKKNFQTYVLQAVLKKEAFNLVVSDKISYTRQVLL